MATPDPPTSAMGEPAPHPAASTGRPPREGIDHGRCCVIITGAPAAGKSTISRRLAERLERSALLNGDQVHWLVVGGRVWALGEPRDEAMRQVDLGNLNLCNLATNCAAAGFTPVVDWIVPDRRQFDFFVEHLAPLPVWVVVLDPGAEEATRRNLTREERFDFDGHDELVAGMRRDFGQAACWLDTSAQDAEETFAALCRIARLDEPTGAGG